MPIGTPAGNLDIKNATLRTSNLETQNIKIGSIFVGTGNSLEETANVGNSMSNTIQFTNTHTAFTTTGNVTVGKELTVTGDVTVDTDTLHVDSTNNRVGVGTTNPNVLLELSSDTGSATIVPTELRLSSSTNATDWDTTNPYARLAFYTEDVTADAPGVMASIGAVASSVDGGENTRLAFFTAEPHVERMCIDRNGNVGVGTTSASGTLDVSSTRTGLSGLTTNEATLMISCTDDQAADDGDIGGGVVFRQRWYNANASLVPTGGIYGYKDRNSGSYGGGLLFTRCPDNGTGGALTEAMRITKEGNVVIGATQIRGDGDIKFSTQAYTGIRHVTASTNASSYVAINVGKLYRGDNSGVAAFVTYSPVYISSSNSNNNALYAVGMFKFTQVKVRGTGTQMRAVTDFYSYDNSTVSLSINGNQETIIAISSASYANRSYMAVVHFVNTGIHGL